MLQSSIARFDLHGQCRDLWQLRPALSTPLGTSLPDPSLEHLGHSDWVLGLCIVDDLQRHIPRNFFAQERETVHLSVTGAIFKARTNPY